MNCRSVVIVDDGARTRACPFVAARRGSDGKLHAPKYANVSVVFGSRNPYESISSSSPSAKLWHHEIRGTFCSSSIHVRPLSSERQRQHGEKLRSCPNSTYSSRLPSVWRNTNGNHRSPWRTELT